MPAADSTIADRLARVRERIHQAAEAAGRDPDSVRLIAVSKTVAADAVREAHTAGQLAFGENRVQELIDKHDKLPGDLQWHMIGHVQSNKVKDVVRCADLVHSVDRAKILRRLDRLAGEAGKIQPILLQANVSGEESKFGGSLKDVEKLLLESLELPNVECRGFMTMAPYGAAESSLHGIFRELADFRGAVAARLGISLPELSMGMSNDFEIAIAEGATLVRIGTAIFGERQTD